MSAPVTTLFAGGLGVMYAGLQLRVGLYRKDSGVHFGTATKEQPEGDAFLTGISRAGECVCTVQQHCSRACMMTAL